MLGTNLSPSRFLDSPAPSRFLLGSPENTSANREAEEICPLSKKEYAQNIYTNHDDGNENHQNHSSPKLVASFLKTLERNPQANSRFFYHILPVISGNNDNDSTPSSISSPPHRDNTITMRADNEMKRTASVASTNASTISTKITNADESDESISQPDLN
eukprot:CAMPEP_0203702174 /NCGR_PEP_ID=MMETSP0091-20130426/38463_1 /ASSEMBLY_ACC=CAM_ASM_001089 /TAXON_ID=426623 /ORGANISM="Chaetoceros affinis, Strain CCMP159" /LENGTH=159 /DNA_ID=CAMNT_0050576223 /DNA_START=120 /DNA_END=596 /DNA_ORIENTATION=-